MKKLTLVLTTIIMVAACKKDKNGGIANQRISRILSGSEQQLLAYDNQKRITRIDYNAANSLRFEYSAAGVFIQQYGAGDVPNPDRKYDFTIVNNKITSGHRYLPGNFVDNFYYGYDEQEKLTTMTISRRFDGTEYEQHTYSLLFDEQKNVQSVVFKRKTDNKNSDSIFISRTYYSTSFISWRDMGFDYFGSASVGQEHLGYGIVMPFSILGGAIYPGNHALKTSEYKQFTWNPVTSKWIPRAPSGYTRAESEYQYDNNGRLIYYGGSEIKWQ